jgi:hypothetical protein
MAFAWHTTSMIWLAGRKVDDIGAYMLDGGYCLEKGMEVSASQTE